jgi:hypothetical protein
MNKAHLRIRILELCSESECGSWELWSTKDNKTEEECKNIVEALIELVKGKKIIVTDGKYVDDHSYREVPLDVVRLESEVRQSIKPYNVDPHTFYWFYATEEGKKEDQANRSPKMKS